MSLSMTHRQLLCEAGLTVRLCWYPPDCHMDEHSHQLNQLSVLLAGSFSETSHGRKVWNTPAMVGFKPTGIGHANVYGESGALILSINAVSDYMVGSGDWVWSAIHPQQNQLAQSLLAKGQTPLQMRDLALDLLEYASGPFPVDRHIPAWARRLREQINEDPGINLELVAKREGLHRAYISRGFRKWFGVSPSIYAQRCRLGRAFRMIADGTPKATAAIEAGFSDQSHLTRIMRREAGLTPGEFGALVAA